LPIEKLDSVKRRLSGVYRDTPIPIVGIIGYDAIVRLSLNNDLLSFAAVLERI
jgi:hypothetical protein